MQCMNNITTKDTRLCDKKPATMGWYWKQTHHDEFVLTDLKDLRYTFGDYLSLCWFAGSNHINATQI
jgi:hypothetical protein